MEKYHYGLILQWFCRIEKEVSKYKIQHKKMVQETGSKKFQLFRSSIALRCECEYAIFFDRFNRFCLCRTAERKHCAVADEGYLK